MTVPPTLPAAPDPRKGKATDSASGIRGGGGAGAAMSTGRTVLLHFACRAELPIGSTLRVTSSQLWAPAALSAPSDPSDAHAASARVGSDAFHSGVSGAPGGSIGVGADNVEAEDAVHGLDDANAPNGALYASSVEMGTTPETYPVWRTRTPVVTVLHGGGPGGSGPGSRAVQHHRYRYLVVTPGVDETHLAEIREEHTEGGVEGSGAATTDEEGVGGLQVMMWEDPFAEEGKTDGDDKKSSNSVKAQSALSLCSFRKNSLDDVPRNLADLPFRTIDIDAETGEVIVGGAGGMAAAPDGDGDAAMEDCGEGGDLTEDGIKIDTWQRGDDISFLPYTELVKMYRRNGQEKLQKLDSDMTDFSEDVAGSSTASPLVDYAAAASYPSSASTSPASTPLTVEKQRKQRIFFLCFHLPVIVTKDAATGQWDAIWSESLMARTEGSDVVRRNEAHWIGTVTTKPAITSNRDREAVRSILAAMDCTPLFIEDDVCSAHYYGMCKQVLWPALHNVDLMDIKINTMDSGADKAAESGEGGGEKTSKSSLDQTRFTGWWDAYVSVNKSFAEAASAMLRPNDIVWIHDYHLSLLPKMLHENEKLRYGGKVTRKVFFLHIPFCSSMIFKELECGESILTGMLHADVVGFHSFDHARHFLSAAKRLVGVNYESLVGGLIGMRYMGRTVLVTMHNVSVEPQMVDAALALPSLDSSRRALLQKHQGRTIISGVDIAQRLSGISHKLVAYERLLQDYRFWKDKIVLVQKCLIPGSRRVDEEETISEIRYLVQRIQARFGESVIDYEEHSGSSLPIDQRLALWTISDVFINTCVKEGLNMQPLEYIYARKDSKTPGVVVASEFSAVVSILNGALRINPFDPQKASSIIDKALTMDMQEREGRRGRDIDFVSASPSSKWTANVLRDLNDVMNGGDNEGREDSRAKNTFDSIAAFLSRENALAFSHLDSSSVLKAYNSTSQRVIIVDFNGTIVIKEAPGKYLKREILGSSGYKPPASVHKALQDLCADPCNTVFVVSGDSRENVDNSIGAIPGLGLAASNGVTFSRPLRQGESTRTWQSFDLGVDWEAVKRAALPIMSRFTARTNGSFVKLTHSSLGWSYYSCDPEWGSLQASHLVLELEEALRGFDVRFVTLKGIIEIVPRRLNKGLIVKKVLRDVAAKDSGVGVDFILCMGDDISDEKMFTSVFSYVAELQEDSSNIVASPPIIGEDSGSSVVSGSDAPMEEEEDSPRRQVGSKAPMYCFTATVGKKPSHAAHYVNDARDVASLLVALSGGEESSLVSGSFDSVDNGAGLFV